jgi:F-type H+-transporting ATPase subunit delta
MLRHTPTCLINWLWRSSAAKPRIAMAEKATIARPYAKAAFEFALQHKSFDRWSHVLATAAALVSDERVKKLLTSPRVTTQDLISLVTDAVSDAVDEPSRNFVATLAHYRRLGLLPEIASQFETLRAEIENVADVRITSAVQLSDEQRQQLSTALQKRLKREVRLHCEVDASLIGGAIVRAGDFVIDGSLRARLERLSGAMTH